MPNFLSNRLSARRYPSWSAMPDRLLVFFLTLSTLLVYLDARLFEIAKPDINELLRLLNNWSIFWQIPGRDWLLLTVITIDLLAFGAIGLWAAWLAAGCSKLLINRHFGPPAA